MKRPTRDERFMDRALALAARGLGRTFPNPAVGAVFVRGGRVVGEGYHRRAGGPHAEIEALRRAGRRAEGADLYVTLEPCTFRGRTPPCVAALLPLGLRRVVVAASDPHARVRGRGVARLQRAGVAVSLGVRRVEGEALVRGYRMRLARGRPWVTLKLAMTIDGRIAMGSGESRWITGGASRRLVHRLRAETDAVMVGAGTVRVDDPTLTCRTRGGANPVRVVVCSTDLRLPARARVLRDGKAPTWVVAAHGASARAVARLERRGVAVVLVAGRGGRPSFGAVMAALASRGITSVVIEGGGQLAAAALRARVVDDVVLFLAPLVFGADGVPAVGTLGVRRISRAVRLVKMRIERSGRDVVVRAGVRYPR